MISIEPTTVDTGYRGRFQENILYLIDLLNADTSHISMKKEFINEFKHLCDPNVYITDKVLKHCLGTFPNVMMKPDNLDSLYKYMEQTIIYMNNVISREVIMIADIYDKYGVNRKTTFHTIHAYSVRRFKHELIAMRYEYIIHPNTDTMMYIIYDTPHYEVSKCISIPTDYWVLRVYGYDKHP
jgi:hypothetical protein